MAQRERRPSADNRMAKMPHEEEEDMFHQTTYGGFQEEEDNSNNVARVDIVDSEFEIFKDHEPVSFRDEEEEKAMQHVVTKRNQSPKREWVAGLGKQQPKKLSVNKSKKTKPLKDKEQNKHIELESNKVNPVNNTITGPELRCPSIAVPIEANVPVMQEDDDEIDLSQILNWDEEVLDRNIAIEIKALEAEIPDKSIEDLLRPTGIEPIHIIVLKFLFPRNEHAT